MKYYYSIIGLAIALFICSWIFNHVNAWAAIGTFLIMAGILINYLINLLNKKQDEKN